MSGQKITITEAAKLTGVSKSGLLKAIHKGRISAERDDETKQFRVDPAELFRVYAPIPSPPKVSHEVINDNALLEQKVSHLEQMVYTLKDERDDLRTRLDKADSERTRLTLLLTDTRTVEHKEPTSTNTNKKPWLIIGLSVFSVVCVVASVWYVLANRAG